MLTCQPRSCDQDSCNSHDVAHALPCLKGMIARQAKIAVTAGGCLALRGIAEGEASAPRLMAAAESALSYLFIRGSHHARSLADIW